MLVSSKQSVWTKELNYIQNSDNWKSIAIKTKNCSEFLLQRFEEVFIELFVGEVGRVDKVMQENVMPDYGILLNTKFGKTNRHHFI